MLAGGGLDDVKHQGDLGALQRLLSVLETPPATFAIGDAIGPGGWATGTPLEAEITR